MSAVWIASVVLLWLVVAALCVLGLALVRQIKALERRAAGGSGLALDVDDGPALGAYVPPTTVELVGGGVATFGGERGAPSLIVFVSPSCLTCKGVPAMVRRLRAVYGRNELEVLTAVRAHPSTAAEWAADVALEGTPLTTFAAVPEPYTPKAGMPFAFTVTREGFVAARAAPDSLAVYHEIVARALRYGAPADARPTEQYEEVT